LTQLPSRFRRADRTHDGGDAQAAQRQPRVGLWHLALIVAVVALIALNAATLLSDRIHTWAYDIVSPVVQAICGMACLENSPTESRRREFEAAAHKAEQRYEALREKTLALVAATGTLIVATELTVATMNNLAGTYQSLKNVARSTANRVAGRLYRGSTRRVASMAGQAIPIIGSTLIWGLTAVEIHDACDAMTDLAALDAEIGDGKGVDLGTVCGIKIPTVAQVTEGVARGWTSAYQAAAELINGDGRVSVPAEAGRPTDAQARGLWCRIFGC